MKELEKFEALLLQQVNENLDSQEALSKFKDMVANYVWIENALGVLTDILHKKSYIFKGNFPEKLGFNAINEGEIDTVFEYEIYKRIHPDDLLKRNLMEIEFFYFIQSIPVELRHLYCTKCLLRMIDVNGDYFTVTHKTLYLKSQNNGTLEFELCLYQEVILNQEFEGFSACVMNSQTGEKVFNFFENQVDVLSKRETEILTLVAQGLSSKEIANMLHLSKNTIDRHRQNIMSKLKVSNSIEAVKNAKKMKIIP